MAYGAETITFTRETVHRIRVAQRAMERVSHSPIEFVTRKSDVGQKFNMWGAVFLTLNGVGQDTWPNVMLADGA